MTAVNWTDVVQMARYNGGAVLSLIAILHFIRSRADGPTSSRWPDRWESLHVFDFRLGPAAQFFARPYSFWAGIL